MQKTVPMYIYDLFKSLITYDYDSFGRVIKETRQNYNNNITQTTEYTYDANNNATSLIVKVNNSVIQNLNYEYTYGNKLERVLKNSSEIASYEYNQAGLLEKYMTPINAVEYFYNQQNLLTQMINYKDRNMSQVDSTFTYTYYLNGNQASKTEVNGTTRYEYDSLGRLKKEYAPDETVTYDYDFLGNRIKKEVTNSQNPYTVNYNYNITLLTSEQKIVPSTNETEYTYYNYDPLGNLISKTYEKIAPSTGSDKLTFDATESAKYTTMYEYDPYNKLARVINENGEIEFNYYADGLRYSKTVNGAKTYYIWNGSNIIAETDANGSLITNYYRGLQIIASETPSDNVGLKYYSYNGHGDVFKLTDRNKNVIVSYEYDAFGNQKNSIANDTNPFRYCGEYFDGETGLIYLRARYYDPGLGRFISEDPIRDGLNWYVYCGNNPIRFIDPSGLLEMYVQPENGLNVRSGPGTSYKIICTLAQGTKVNTIDMREVQRPRANGYRWIQLESGGWVADEFLGAYSPTVKSDTAMSTPVVVEATADGRRSLPLEGEPNSTDTLYKPDGTPKQERKYGPDGKPEYDDDYSHAGDGHGIGFPHRHPWVDGKRSKTPIPVPPAEASSAADWGTVIVGVVTIIELTSYLFGMPVDIPGN